MWVCQTESVAFWMGVLTNLKNRGVEDILITSTDNLRGFVDAIKTVFPLAKTQICIIHQLRNSLKFVVWKDKKLAAIELLLIYNAPEAEQRLIELKHFNEKWGHKYPYIVKSGVQTVSTYPPFLSSPTASENHIYNQPD